MTFVQSDNVVEQLAPATADPTLGNAVLPGTLKRDLDASDLHESNGRRHCYSVLGIVIEDEIFGSGLVRKRFS